MCSWSIWLKLNFWDSWDGIVHLPLSCARAMCRENGWEPSNSRAEIHRATCLRDYWWICTREVEGFRPPPGPACCFPASLMFIGRAANSRFDAADFWFRGSAILGVIPPWMSSWIVYHWGCILGGITPRVPAATSSCSTQNTLFLNW